MMARWKESDEPQPTSINKIEKLALRHRNLTSSYTTYFPISNLQDIENTQKNDNSSSSGTEEDFFDTQQIAHSDDDSDKQNMAAFDVQKQFVKINNNKYLKMYTNVVKKII